MSHRNNESPVRRVDRKKMLVRAFCLFLAILMVGSVAYTLIVLLAQGILGVGIEQDRESSEIAAQTESDSESASESESDSESASESESDSESASESESDSESASESESDSESASESESDSESASESESDSESASESESDSESASESESDSESASEFESDSESASESESGSESASESESDSESASESESDSESASESESDSESASESESDSESASESESGSESASESESGSESASESESGSVDDPPLEPIVPEYKDIKLRIGLVYGANVQTIYKVSTVNGYIIGAQSLIDEDKTFTELWRITNNDVIVMLDTNIWKYNGEYLPTNGEWGLIGSHHIQLAREFASLEDAMLYILGKSTELSWYAMSAFPAYDNGKFYVRIGSFYNASQAGGFINTIAQILPNEEMYVAGPTSTSVTLVDPYTDKIILEYDGGENTVLGLAARPKSDEKTYIKTPAGDLFDGVFAFSHYNVSSYNGISVISVISLEDYVAGVLPYEILNTWPLETQKAFAISVRSFAVSKINLHYYAYSFDLCNTAHCQVYRGISQINDNVLRAVDETKGQIIVYGNTICSACYSSSVGGITVNSLDCWGSVLLPYLAPKRTPWEDYYNYYNGFWIKEVSPTELLSYLRDTKGYTNLTGSYIADVTIDQLATDSTYVKTVTFTDNTGAKVTLTTTDKIRVTLGKYLNSANFVVGKGSVEYSYDLVKTYEEYEESLRELENGGVLSVKFADFSIKNAIETIVSSINGALSVITGDGTLSYDKTGANVITKDNAGLYVELPDDDGEKNETLYSYIKHDVAEASSAENFIFVGKGWGHGVGLSQYGAKDLADLGLSYTDILFSYFNDTVIVDFREFAEQQ